jgi:penicillin-binding protein 2
MEEGKIGPGDVISCPYHDAGRSWPNCLMFRRFGSCHDWRWQDEGGNIARNAIRGSCNVYFSRLANRIDVRRLQEWLLRFGYGRKILPGPDFSDMPDAANRAEAANRNLRQSAGQISVRVVPNASSIEDIPNMGTFEKRMFGIGQGNIWTTVLQVTNAMAVIARGGMYKSPRLFLSGSDGLNDRQEYIGISATSIRTVRDGMSAVVYEAGGTAYSTFENSGLGERDVKVFGKTGSTERPNNAWFACFAEDGSGRSIAIAIVVEGGQSGSRDAAPLGREIIRMCNEAGYIGKQPQRFK